MTNQKNTPTAKEQEFTTKDILLFHWKEALRHKKPALVSLVVSPLTIILEKYITPLIIAALLMGIQSGTISFESSWWMIAAYATLQILTNIIGERITLYTMWAVQIAGTKNLYKESYEKLTKQSMTFYNNTFAGSLVSRVNKFSTIFMQFWWMVIYNLIPLITVVLATLIAMGFILWQYTVVLAGFTLFYIITAYYGTRFMRPRQKARSKAYTQISAQLSDSISNMLAVKIDSKEKLERARFQDSVETLVDKEKAVRSGIITISMAYQTINMLIRVSVLVFSIWAVQVEIANAAAIYLALTYTFNLIGELSSVTAIMRTVYQITGDSEEMLETLAEDISIKDTSSKKLSVKKGEITINELSFSHADANKTLFKNLSLIIPAGQKVGVVGVSGSGKTTLTKLLLRFIDPSNGHIAIDGMNISKVSQTSLHNAISYVPQEPLLFHRTITENISYSRPDASVNEVAAAAKKAHADEFIKTLSDGYDTLVGERGVKLSGGQRQRIAIARAILKDAPILILDEATSALDSESEALIQSALDELMKNRTSIVIAHRLSTIAKLDRIIVMKDGAIIEDGSHAELIKQNGDYAKLWKHQSGGFIDDGESKEEEH